MKRRFDAFSLLYAMMLIAVLLLTVAGARLCRTLTASRDANYQLRSTLAYTQSKLNAADTQGGVRLEQGPEGDLLVLSEAGGSYETRIYLYEGALREELSPVGSALAPEGAQSICPAGSFSVTWLREGLLCVEADGLRAFAALNSEGGVTLASQ